MDKRFLAVLLRFFVEFVVFKTLACQPIPVPMDRRLLDQLIGVLVQARVEANLQQGGCCCLDGGRAILMNVCVFSVMPEK